MRNRTPGRAQPQRSQGQALASGAVSCPKQVNPPCGGDDVDHRCRRRAGCPGSRGPGRPGTEAGRVADPVVGPGPGRPDLPPPTGRRGYRRGRARRGGRLRGARGQPGARGYGCGRVPPRQSLARMVVPADVDRPVVGSDRGSSRGGRRGRAVEEAAPGGRAPWALAAAVCLSRVYLGAHFPLDVAAGAGLGVFIGGVLNLVVGVPGNSPSTARAGVETRRPSR